MPGIVCSYLAHAFVTHGFVRDLDWTFAILQLHDIFIAQISSSVQRRTITTS